MTARMEDEAVATRHGRTGGRRPVFRSARARLLPGTSPVERQRSVLERRLRTRLGAPVELEVTDNTYTMISFARRQGTWRVRLHHMFLRADDGVLDALGHYVRGDDRSASAALDRFIHLNRRLIRQLSPATRQQRLPLQTAGRWHDLQKLLDEVLEEGLVDGTGVAIAWAPAPRVKLPRRSIKLGSYSADTQIIRIHPALDQPEVPAYFIRWIIHHELLHHHFRADLKARRGRVHTPEFCRLEKLHPDYAAALAWERRNLDLLLWWDPDSVPVRRAYPTGDVPEWWGG